MKQNIERRRNTIAIILTINVLMTTMCIISLALLYGCFIIFGMIAAISFVVAGIAGLVGAIKLDKKDELQYIAKKVHKIEEENKVNRGGRVKDGEKI